MIVVNILLVLNVSAYFSTVAEGPIPIAAALAAAASRDSGAGACARRRRAGAHGAPACCRASWAGRTGG